MDVYEKYDQYEDKWKTNRQKARLFKPGLYWCDCCDMNMVRDWVKCGVCGHRSGKRRNKERIQ